MLAEVTIVSALVATVMVVMYAASSKMIKAYEVRENYYNIDTIYATGYIYNHLIDTLDINNLIGSDNYTNIKDRDDYIKSVCSYYGLSQVYFIKENTEKIKSLSGVVTNKTFKNYINNYLVNAIEDSNKYIILVERVVEKEYYYYYIEV